MNQVDGLSRICGITSAKLEPKFKRPFSENSFLELNKRHPRNKLILLRYDTTGAVDVSHFNLSHSG